MHILMPMNIMRGATMDNSLLALLAGLGIACIAGPLGCFVVWRRMAYFGDSLSHSALLGIALGMLGGFSMNIGIMIVSFVFASLLIWLQQKKILATDTLLGILAHAALAIGMVSLSFIGEEHFDIHEYFFGDIWSVNQAHLAWIYGAGGVVLILLVKYWNSLLLMTIHEDLAKAEHIPTIRMHFLLMAMMTVLVTVSIQIVGILLVTSMLIIPAATARQIAISPKMMGISSAALAVVAVLVGLMGSKYLDLPSGPAIVSASAVLFMIVLPLSFILKPSFLKRGR